jgi:hypothetical protein
MLEMARSPAGNKSTVDFILKEDAMPADSKQGRKHDRCVEKVKKSGGAKNPYAVCNSNSRTRRPKSKSD